MAVDPIDNLAELADWSRPPGLSPRGQRVYDEIVGSASQALRFSVDDLRRAASPGGLEMASAEDAAVMNRFASQLLVKLPLGDLPLGLRQQLIAVLDQFGVKARDDEALEDVAQRVGRDVSVKLKQFVRESVGATTARVVGGAVTVALLAAYLKTPEAFPGGVAPRLKFHFLGDRVDVEARVARRDQIGAAAIIATHVHAGDHVAFHLEGAVRDGVVRSLRPGVGLTLGDVTVSLEHEVHQEIGGRTYLAATVPTSDTSSVSFVATTAKADSARTYDVGVRYLKQLTGQGTLRPSLELQAGRGSSGVTVGAAISIPLDRPPSTAGRANEDPAWAAYERESPALADATTLAELSSAVRRIRFFFLDSNPYHPQAGAAWAEITEHRLRVLRASDTDNKAALRLTIADWADDLGAAISKTPAGSKARVRLEELRDTLREDEQRLLRG